MSIFKRRIGKDPKPDPSISNTPGTHNVAIVYGVDLTIQVSSTETKKLENVDPFYLVHCEILTNCEPPQEDLPGLEHLVASCETADRKVTLKLDSEEQLGQFKAGARYRHMFYSTQSQSALARGQDKIRLYLTPEQAAHALAAGSSSNH